MSTTAVEPIDPEPLGERERQLVRRLLSDPFSFPPEFPEWIRSMLERDPPVQAPVRIPSMLNVSYVEYAPRAPAASSVPHAARLEVVVNPSGKGELRCYWPGGAYSVVSTEP